MIKKQKKKGKKEIPRTLAARILFISDRTCCVCRTQGKPVQIHHIDENPKNNVISNLAVLCFDCHRDTQIHGGFDRKLDADQVVLYRDDWHRIVAHQRVSNETHMETMSENGHRLELVTSIAEIYRENKEYELLVMHYHSIGNYELRDKYIEYIMKTAASDQTICYLRSLQGKPNLIPDVVINREIARYTKDKDWLQRARFFRDLGRYREAASDYILGIGESLDENGIFSAAYYLKEIVEKGLIDELFIIALAQAEKQGELWWQVRALQELDWQDELKALILKNSKKIEKMKHPLLLELLASAKGEIKRAIEIRKDIARNTRSVVMNEEADEEKSPKTKKVRKVDRK